MKAFTLIELLVVLSIIGLLASIVLVSLEGGEQRAVTGKAMNFSQTVRTALGADLIGEWKFDNATNPVVDSSGGGNNGTVISFPFQVDGIFGKAMEFDGLDDRIDYGSNFNLPTAFTVEAWVKPDVYGSLDYVIWRNDDRPGIRMNGNKWLLMVDGNNGNSISSLSDVKTGVWTHLVLAYDGAIGRAYINGVEENSRASAVYGQGTVFRIGGDGAVDRYFDGLIDEVRIYNRALYATEIQRLYVFGAAKHSLTLK